ncbi:hypothetical protein BDV12DRAFT_194002 [Aspergillus spectabilis]
MTKSKVRSESWRAALRHTIIAENPVDRLIHEAPESLVFEAIQALLRQAKQSKTEEIKIEKKVVCWYCEEGSTYLDGLLVIATELFFVRCMRLLVESGADASLRILKSLLLSNNAALGHVMPPGVTDWQFQYSTPLEWAIYKGRAEIADVLFKAGAISPVDPVQWCAWNGDEEVLKALLENGVEIDNEKYQNHGLELLYDPQDDHPIDLAILRDNVSSARALIVAGGDEGYKYEYDLCEESGLERSSKRVSVRNAEISHFETRFKGISGGLADFIKLHAEKRWRSMFRKPTIGKETSKPSRK